MLVFHRDEEYVSALSRALAIKDSIYAITLAEGAKLSLQGVMAETTHKNYDLVLVDQEWKTEADHLEAENRERLIGLCETPSRSDVEGYIYKYGGLDRISSELQLAYARVTGKSRTCLNEHSTRIIGFTSSAGGVGTSSIAIAVGRELTSLDRKDALYISFEKTESTPVYIPMDEGRASIGEYLYYLITKEKEASSSFIDSFLISDVYGLCAFRPSKTINELTTLSLEQQMNFLNSICSSGRFRYILMDYSGQVSTETWQLMLLSSKIFLIDDGLPLSFWKNQKFVRNIPSEIFEEIQDRIHPVTNKWVPKDCERTDCQRFYLEYDPGSFQAADSNINICLQYCFGLGVKRIADELTTEL